MNVSTETRGITLYKSGLERSTARHLETLGQPFEYESVEIPYWQERTYTPDFWLPNGILVETKGWWKSADRTKHNLVRSQHPELDIRFVFQNARNKLARKSKTTYADYCSRKGWKWAEGRIPNSWLAEPVKVIEFG